MVDPHSHSRLKQHLQFRFDRLRVIHRDLKPENILLDLQGCIAVADYGSCKQFVGSKEGDREYTQCGTSFYMVPEMIVGKGYSYEVDWWSIGVISFEMIVGEKPFQYDKHINDEELCCSNIGKGHDLPNEVVTTLQFLESFANYSGIYS
ncbi:cAMP-dependent protein kinase catalytic subunit gamma-like [Zootermopsis nevadensis]|uniref:cAMP-dependent protein kinase catalytic subunit gamma-like n=1 Tax=Zootermopsis nevadensis TaxID=136037 RepID=UPI000B8ECDFB|nr:cAMP-dependent protein kinase catalytic subunit gamma-like [Zootermopsis nevadensis]